MIGNRRFLGAAVAAVLVASLGALAGCASEEKQEAALTGKQVQAASVTLTVHDVNGAAVGQGSGILIAPRLVLTSAHLVAGKARWSVTSADGTVKSNGIRGMTYDWMDYDNSQKAHPRKHDVAVIYLDKPINLAAYPKLSQDKLANGAAGTRLRTNGSSVLQIPQTFTKVVGFPHAYLTDMPATESVEPGGAVLNEHNEIVGVVTGRGLTTGKMYVARVEDVTDWVKPKAQCGGRSNASVRTYGTPPPKPGCDTPGSSSSSGSTSGNTSSGSSGASSSGSSGESSSGSSGASSSGSSGESSSGQSSGTSGTSGQSSGSSGSSSGGTDNPSCNDGGGHCHGNCHGIPGGGSSSGSSGASSSGSSGTSGNTSSGSSGQSSSGSSGASSSGSSGQSSSGSSGASSSGSSGTSGNTSSGSSGQSSSGSSGASSSGSSGESSSGSSGASSSGSSGTSGNTSSGSSGQTSSGSSGASSGSSGNTSSSGGAGSENGGDEEVCEGPSDNPETCPPEADGCSGSGCGGAFAPDGLIDYGGSVGTSDGDGDPLVVR